jgi:hypothetical protein
MVIDSIEILDPSGRGKGMGSELLRHIEAQARAAGMKQAWATSVMGDAEGFWAKMGYKHSGNKRIWVKDLASKGSARESYDPDAPHNPYRDEQGRYAPGPESKAGKLIARAKRAKSSHKVASQAVQRQAEANEPKLAQALGGEQMGDNDAFDVTVGKNAIEVKTLVRGSNDKITMHPTSLARKIAEGRARGLKLHTVVFDDRTGKMYYKAGVGSFRLSAMTEVQDLDELKVVLK